MGISDSSCTARGQTGAAILEANLVIFVMLKYLTL